MFHPVILNGAKRSEESQILRFAQDDNDEILRFAQDNDGGDAVWCHPVILNGAKRSEESQILRFAQDDNGEILRFAQDNEGTIAPAYFRAYGSRARPPLGRAVLGRKF